MDVLKAYNKIKTFPFGKSIFSWIVAKQAPYFLGLKAKVVELKKGLTIVEMKERKDIQNHIKTIHAIAMCNQCELAMGLAATVNAPKNIQWIPKGMSVEYKKIAKGTLRAVVNLNESDFIAGDVPVQIDLFDEKKVNVMSATITLYVKEK